MNWSMLMKLVLLLEMLMAMGRSSGRIWDKVSNVFSCRSCWRADRRT